MKNLQETEIQDSDGRIVISPGLKVRHKKSQYEYTVDSISQDEEGENLVVLNLPDEPRFEPEPSSSSTAISDLSKQDVIYEVDPSVLVYEPSEEEPEDVGQDFIAVPQDEFEKEYEVK